MGERLENSFLIRLVLPALFVWFWMAIIEEDTGVATLNSWIIKNLFDNSAQKSIIYQVFRDERYFNLLPQLFIRYEYSIPT